MAEPKFTIFTPTFNSAKVIHRAYESVAAQTCRDFEWLVIDDASSDNTIEILSGWKAKSNIPMRIILKERNLGLFDSYNVAMQEARGEFFVGAAHDDRFDPESLQFFADAWEGIPPDQRHRFCGITVQCRNEKGAVADDFPANGMDSNFLDMYYQYRRKAEQWSIFRTEILRKFSFPARYRAGGEGALVWFPMAEHYQSRYFNRPLRTYYSDNPGSISANTDPRKYAEGMTVVNRRLMAYSLQHPYGTLSETFLCAARYLRFAVHADNRFDKALRQLKGKSFAMALLSSPLALLMILRDHVRHYARCRSS